MLPQAKLDALVARHATVETDLAGQPDRQTYVKLMREFAELGPLVDTVKAYQTTVDEIAGLDALLADSTTDAEMRELAAQERPTLVAKRDRLEQRQDRLFGPAVLEIPRPLPLHGIGNDDRRNVLRIRGVHRA